jgi:hypothetical protein
VPGHNSRKEMAAEVADYQERYQQRFRPVGQRECELVESMAKAGWRLARIPALEESLFVRGQVEFANHFAECDPAERPALIEAQTYLAYEKQFKLLARQETQLLRSHERDEKLLDSLQKKRREEQAIPRHPAKLFLVPRKKG